MADDDEVNLSSEEEYETPAKKKRKAKATSSTHEPAVKKKKGPKAKKTRSRAAKYYDDSDDDFGDDPESEEEDNFSDDGDEIPIARTDLAEISSDESEDSYDADLYRDDADRVTLSRMTDIARQAILYERAEKRNQIRERNSLKAQLRAARGLPSSSKAAKQTGATSRSRSKASAAAAPARPVSGKKAALDALKEKRKASAESAGRARRTRKDGSDEEADYNPSMEAAKAKVPAKETARAMRLRLEMEAREQRAKDRHRVDSDEETDPASHDVVYDDSGKRVALLSEVEYKDLLKMVVKRDELVRWVTNTEFWEKSVKGTFARVSLGQDTAGNPTYRVVEIIDYNPEGRPYSVPAGPNFPSRQISLTLKIAIGGTTKDFTIDNVSNGKITEEEFNDWATRVKSQNLALPTKKTSLRVAKTLQTARNYVRTDADIEREIKRQEEARLAKLNEGSHEQRSSRDLSSDIVSQINKRNRGVNTTVEAAYVPESAKESANNPFARLPTLTTMFGSKSTSDAPTPTNTSETTMSNQNNATLTSKPSSSSISLDMDVSARPSQYPSSQGSRGPSSYNTHSQGNRAGPASTLSANGPKPGRVVSFAQYLNRR